MSIFILKFNLPSVIVPTTEITAGGPKITLGGPVSLDAPAISFVHKASTLPYLIAF